MDVNKRAFGDPPLTTTFSLQRYCTNDVYRIITASCEYLGTAACTYLHLGPTDSNSGCLPSGWNADSTLYFSPGICPQGLTQACSNVITDGSKEETRATCCPTSYHCETGTLLPWHLTEHCERVLAPNAVVTYTQNNTGGSAQVLSTTVGDRDAINAYGIVIRWQSNDFLTTPTGQSTTSGSESNTISQEAAATTSSSNKESGGLSSGAKIGIGVGVALGALLVALGVLLLLQRHRKSKKAQQVPMVQDDPSKQPPYVDNPQYELASQGVTHELEGNHHYQGTGYSQPTDQPR